MYLTAEIWVLDWVVTCEAWLCTHGQLLDAWVPLAPSSAVQQ